MIIDIQKYLSCKKYIKINKKSVLGIYEPLAIPYLQNYLLKLRKFAIENKIGELYKVAFPGKSFYPNRNDRLKYRLWEELGLGNKCLYCGKGISGAEGL